MMMHLVFLTPTITRLRQDRYFVFVGDTFIYKIHASFYSLLLALVQKCSVYSAFNVHKQTQ